MESLPVLVLVLLLLAGPLVLSAHGQTRRPPPSKAELAQLPADGGAEFNRLVFEGSPYLLQHARNPVDWYPWGEEAFARAKEEDKPVFLSIGYSTCHWCHVMEHESFEDEEVAALMNAHFVCVKVDREERPDIDAVYMAVTQAMSGSGGWPMTVFLTPEKKPFFAATYIPKETRFGRKGMLQLVPEIGAVWKARRADIEKSAAEIARIVGESGAETELAANREVLQRGREQLAQRYDPDLGGFGDAPKFPVPHQLLFLLQQHQRTGDALALAMVEKTLAAMRAGGIYDQIGFGFHRYSTDREWLVPHFEKMLYDQALHVLAYTATWQVTEKGEYRAVAEEVIAYVLRDLADPRGGFHSAEDADSEGEEGRFYLWTRAEVLAVLGEQAGARYARVFEITEEGNYREEATKKRDGRSIPHLARSLASWAAELGTGENELARE
ncbi:MAG: thioredoxin domain-containing protein, partial [Planctomycetota bacterium]